MGIAATNDAPAFVRAYKTKDGGGDPFDLKNTMRKFSCSFGQSSDGPGWGCELQLVAPSVAAEKSIMNYLNKNEEDNSFTFEFGWQGVSTSEKIVTNLTDVKYSMNLGQEITLKLLFTRGASQVLERAQMKPSFNKMTSTASLSVNEEKGFGKACVKLIGKVLNIPGVRTAIYGKEVAKKIDETHASLVTMVKEGAPGAYGSGSSGGKPGEYGGFRWQDHNISEGGGNAGGDGMNEALAKDEAAELLVAESPFKVSIPPPKVIRDPDNPDGDLYSLWGDSRNATDNPWASEHRDYDDSPLVGDRGFQAMSTGGSDFQTLLGEENIPAVPAVAQSGFLPMVDGPSESMYKLVHLKSSIYNTAPIFDNVVVEGRLEFWNNGEAPTPLDAADGGYFETSIREWSRTVDGRWTNTPPTFSFLRKNLLKPGEFSPGMSNSFFEVPPPKRFDNVKFGTGVFGFRLTSQSQAIVSAETVKFHSRLEQIDSLTDLLENTDIEGESPMGSQGLNDFIYNSNPFEDDRLYAQEEGGDSGDSGGDDKGEEEVTISLAIEEGEDVKAWLSHVLKWVNAHDSSTESREDLEWKFLDGANISKKSNLGKKVVKNPVKGRTYLVIAPSYMFADADPIASVKSFNIGGRDLTLTVGGWDSIVEGLDVNHSVLAALKTYTVQGPKKSVSKQEAESGTAGEATKEKVGKETSKGEVKSSAESTGKPQAEGVIGDKAADLSTGDATAESQAEVDGEEVDPGDKVTQPTDANITESKGNKDKPIESTKRAAKAAVNWGAAAFQVKVRCLGIPEISSAFETNRRVNLQVPDVRGGSGSHGLSGKYYIVDWSHSISTDVGFKTDLVLQAVENQYMN